MPLLHQLVLPPKAYAIPFWQQLQLACHARYGARDYFRLNDTQRRGCRVNLHDAARCKFREHCGIDVLDFDSDDLLWTYSQALGKPPATGWHLQSSNMFSRGASVEVGAQRANNRILRILPRSGAKYFSDHSWRGTHINHCRELLDLDWVGEAAFERLPTHLSHRHHTARLDIVSNSHENQDARSKREVIGH
eukprot:3140995-Pleurochrysis_carterae.AAC.17